VWHHLYYIEKMVHSIKKSIAAQQISSRFQTPLFGCGRRVLTHFSYRGKLSPDPAIGSHPKPVLIQTPRTISRLHLFPSLSLVSREGNTTNTLLNFRTRVERMHDRPSHCKSRSKRVHNNFTSESLLSPNVSLE